jgi:protein gp37
MAETKIEWTDHSVNPIRARIGEGSGHYCEKVSPGCKNCYSSRLQPRFRMPQFQEQRRVGAVHWLDESKLAEVLRRRKPTKYFWCDMSDMFGEWVPGAWIARCFAVMALTPQHTHQVLTKRSQRMRALLTDSDFREEVHGAMGDILAEWTHFAAPEGWQRFRQADPHQPEFGEEWWEGPAPPWPLPNVWLLVSAEDQPRAEERIPDLLATPAAVRGVSLEPLLGPIVLPWYWCVRCNVEPERHLETHLHCHDDGQVRKLDWAIVGGESGHGARPCDVAWIRSIVEQCRDEGVACFVKQLGAITQTTDAIERFAMFGTPEIPRIGGPAQLVLTQRMAGKGGDPAEWAEDLRVREFPEVRRP